jgi:hypothetical protein
VNRFTAACACFVLAVFSGEVRSENTDLITTSDLTVEKAQQLAADSKGWLSLNGVTSLPNADVVTALCQHKGGGLVLDGVTDLSTASATALSNYPGWLSLSRLTSLSPAIATELAKHKGPGLYLNGVTTLTEDLATRLSAHSGWLSLSGLRGANGGGNNAGNGNGGNGNGANGNGNNNGNAGGNSGNDGGLTQQIAAKLAAHPGPLCLNGITTMTPSVVGALAGGCKGGLDLSGLTTLNNGDSNHLKNHDGWLALDGLTSISDQVAADLAAHNGSVGLLGVTTISNGAKQTLKATGKTRLP